MNFLKIFLSIIILTTTISSGYSQQDKKPYNPNAIASLDIQKAITQAQAENKHIFIQVGGNWCSWCLLLHKFYSEDAQIDSIMNADYVTVMLNYSRSNKNLDILSAYNFPQRFGFPVILILNDDGKLLHTQNTVYLEKDKGYDKKKFISFLKAWNQVALNPKSYQ